MQKEVVVAQEGFEDYFEYLKENLGNLEEEKQAEIDKFVEELNKKYEYKVKVYKQAFQSISQVEYVEVPEEATEEVVEEVTDEPLEA